MSEYLALLHQINRYSHIALAAVGLVVFWIPVIASKGGRLHRVSGKAFAIIAIWVSTTGLIGSVWAVASPLSFAGSLGSKMSEKAQPYIVENARFFFALLAFLSIATLSGIIFGVALVWTKSRHEKLRCLWVTVPLVATIAVALAMAVWGGWNLWLGSRGEHLLPAGGTRKYWLLVILGGIGAWGTWADLRYVLRPPAFHMAWFCKHLECMLGGGIAFYTAFLVFGASRLYEKLGIHLPGMWNLVPWILPSAIGIPLVSRWSWKYQKKYNESKVQT